MRRKTRRIIAGAAGGMAGGVMVAVVSAFTDRLMDQRSARKMPRGLRRIFATRLTQEPSRKRTVVSKTILASAALGGLYGGIRAGLNLPGLVTGPLFGISGLTLSRLGLGDDAARARGPWNSNRMSLGPRLVSTAVYGVVADRMARRVENMLS